VPARRQGGSRRTSAPALHLRVRAHLEWVPGSFLFSSYCGRRCPLCWKFKRGASALTHETLIFRPKSTRLPAPWPASWRMPRWLSYEIDAGLQNCPNGPVHSAQSEGSRRRVSQRARCGCAAGCAAAHIHSSGRVAGERTAGPRAGALPIDGSFTAPVAAACRATVSAAPAGPGARAV
jgi:hypothetical protein